MTRRHPALLAVVVAVTVACSSASTGSTVPECGTDVPGFTAHDADANGTRLHYVIGGSGPAVVLLHGFPETWWTWRDVLPELSRTHTVVAPDLRGVGCSAVDDRGHDTATLARDVHDLVTGLGLGPVAVVGHDVGGWVAYAYARQYRDTTSHLVLSGAALPGFGLEDLLDFRTPGHGLPHLVFLARPDAADLLAGRERAYLDGFVTSEVMHRSGAVDVDARALARTGRLRAALGVYRELHTSAEQNRHDAGPPLPMPTLALAAPGETGQSATDLRRVARDVREVGIPESGHYVQEEQPVAFARALAEFLCPD